jgi:hypothetical protein
MASILMTPDELLAMQRLRLNQSAVIYDDVLISLDDKGWIVPSDGGWMLSASGLARYREHISEL